MSADEEIVSEPLTSALKENNSVEEPSEKTKKTMLRGYRQKLQTVHARIKYRENTIKVFRKHLKNGTFPKRFKSLRPYRKMNSSESQAIVNTACDQVQSVILLQEEERKLTEDQNSYETLKVQRAGDRLQLLKTPKKPKKPTMAQLQQELADLRSKYALLCSKLDSE